MGEKNSGSGKPMAFYQLNGKCDKDVKPFFQKSEKIGDHWEKTKTFDTLSGLLTGAKIEEKTFADGKKNFFVLFLSDDEATRKIQMSHNQITYAIINSIAGGVDCNSEYEISVYRKQSEDGKYWNGRAKVLVRDTCRPGSDQSLRSRGCRSHEADAAWMRYEVGGNCHASFEGRSPAQPYDRTSHVDVRQHGLRADQARADHHDAAQGEGASPGRRKAGDIGEERQGQSPCPPHSALTHQGRGDGVQAVRRAGSALCRAPGRLYPRAEGRLSLWR